MTGLSTQLGTRVLFGAWCVTLLTFSVPAPVSACSCDPTPGPRELPRFPWFNADGYPTNALFTSSLEWRDAEGRVLPLEIDTELSAIFGFEVRRPVDGALPPGAVFFPTDGACPATGTCRHQLVVGASADTTPPSRATIRSLSVLYAEDAPSEPIGTCQNDALVLAVDGVDDVTPADELVTVAYVGATPEEVLAREEPDVAFAYDPGPEDRALTSTIALGLSAGHERDGEGLRRAGPFCFSVALVDWAGNVGQRSEPVCLDTTDPADPSVEPVAYDEPCSGFFCAGAGDEPPVAGAFSLLAFAGLLAWRRRVARRRR